MGGSAMNQFRSLDERYLEFVQTSCPVFTQYPQLEPLRYFIFKELLAQHKGAGWKEVAKHWVRPLMRRSHSEGPLNRADVLLWLEGRPEGMESLLPVRRELALRNIKAHVAYYSR